LKIHIIGCSGSGKTYLADCLSKQHDIPHYDLDTLQFSGESYGVKNAPEKRDAMLRKIISQDNWITEGIYYAWVSGCFESADRIILLDVPRSLCVYRIIRRYIRRKAHIEQGKKEKLSDVIALIRWTKRFCNVNLVEIKKILSQYPDKITVVKTVNDADKIIRHGI